MNKKVKEMIRLFNYDAENVAKADVYIFLIYSGWFIYNNNKRWEKVSKVPILK